MNFIYKDHLETMEVANNFVKEQMNSGAQYNYILTSILLPKQYHYVKYTSS